MLLRVDDTDPARNLPGGEEAILRDLAWLGIEWDEGPARQSERQERYDSGEELLEDVKEWQGCRVPPPVAKAIREAKPPVDIWEQVVLRRFRANRNRG